MHIEQYEKFFLRLTAVTLVLFFGAIAASALSSQVTLHDPPGRVDPAALSSTPPFDAPGVYERDDGEYEVIMIAQTWSFVPNEVRVPEGSTVHFVMTSRDVTHGFMITGVVANVMLLPGQISHATVRFDRPGEHLIICHEYCGLGHQNMFARIFVERDTRAASSEE